jgi:hypothetical protein
MMKKEAVSHLICEIRESEKRRMKGLHPRPWPQDLRTGQRIQALTFTEDNQFGQSTLEEGRGEI